jgi:hypothetical protein
MDWLLLAFIDRYPSRLRRNHLSVGGCAIRRSEEKMIAYLPLRAAWARQNAHIGNRRRKSGQAQGNGKHETARGDLLSDLSI